MRANSLIAIALLASPAIAASLQTLQTVPDGVTSDFPYVDPASIDPQQSGKFLSFVHHSLSLPLPFPN